jgi:acetyl esterase/lipase
VGRTAIFHTLGLSQTSKHWDLKTELIVNLIRSFIVTPKLEPISKTQRLSLKDPGIKGKMWISKVTLPAPAEDDVRQTVFGAIEFLKEPGTEIGEYRKPDVVPVTAEWTGYRSAAHNSSPELKISEQEKYTVLMKEATSSATILYFHGGAHYLMDPCSHRVSNTKLAEFTKGRVFSVRYRLAPQNAFPSALIDALVAYLSLLYPPEGSFHQAVEARNVILAGDSAGGNLAASLLLLLLTLQRQNRKIFFHGAERELPLPGGTALNSPWMDITGSSPSCETNASYDYLPARSVHPKGMSYPSDKVWPATPPRKTLYADDALLCHPLVSPLAAKSELWEGSGPVWMVTGWELLSDEIKVVASRMVKAGVTVVFEDFEAMPHCFALLFEGLEGGRKCYKDWAAFVSAVVENPERVKTKGSSFKAKSLIESEVDIGGLDVWGDEEVLQRMKDRISDLTPKFPDTLAKL